ncbi:MAG: DUF1385 domain-containing protein [Thermoleophilia bacterium]|nr:DUF1385 domain-containing protein [Gaiellaceae bacterium]MDW8338642.1 DUF1385 domain-containing protein [Thermoleophilia bacterium]
MAEPTVRLGGMALQNGVLVHGPTSWACAIRGEDGKLHVASGRKPVLARELRRRAPLLRGPLALADALALLPVVRRALPEARLAFERPAVLAGIALTAVGARALRARSGSPAREAAAAVLGALPAVLALRGTELAAYHGAEHVSIGTYERGGDRAPREHPRCGSQLVAPLLAATLAAHVLAARLPRGWRRIGRAAATMLAVGGAVELHAWAARNPGRALAALVARPGLELQRRFSTVEPSQAQLEVADAARDACLELELASA